MAGSLSEQSLAGRYEFEGDYRETIVTLILECDPKPDGPMPPAQVERPFTEQVIPAMLAGLQRYVETGRPPARMRQRASSGAT